MVAKVAVRCGRIASSAKAAGPEGKVPVLFTTVKWLAQNACNRSRKPIGAAIPRCTRLTSPATSRSATAARAAFTRGTAPGTFCLRARRSAMTASACDQTSDEGITG